jgi:hypothetical protein
MSLSWWDSKLATNVIFVPQFWQFSVDAPIMNHTELPHSRGEFGVILGTETRYGVGKFHPTSVSQKYNIFVTVFYFTKSKSTFWSQKFIWIVLKIPWPKSASEVYRSSDRRLSAKLVPTFSDRRWQVVSMTDPYGRDLGFIDRSRYFLFQVPPQLYSRGWVGPVPDPLLLRKSDSAGNRTRTSLDL